jgi:transcriptional regulator with XRE-family HTH domain
MRPPTVKDSGIRTLRELRREAGLRQRDVADRMGTVQNAITRLESGQHHPRWTTLCGFVEACGGQLRVMVDMPDGTERLLVVSDHQGPSVTQAP